FRQDKIAVNALWPRTSIATAAVRNLLGGKTAVKHSRKPEIVADAAYLILTKPSNECTGNFFIDEDLLIESGITNLEKYAVDPTKELYFDFFLQ
ncbi:MAG: short chain dehydrogenase, partial [Promethearchaeota archaeon]